ncbi:MAG: type II toxin-antitoxin system HicB family antitoxin [Acidobacteriota bacterium]|nr:type II toxin-antitoxin system HicB family antitoxin [Acidobacteriota bacterium]
MRQVVVRRGEDGQWVAERPSLPGCITQGRSREEAIENARDAVEQCIAALEEDRLPVPPETFDTLVVAV